MKKLIVLIVLFCCRIGIVYSDSVIFLGEFYLFFPSAHTSAIEPKITVGFDDTYCSFQIKAFSDYTVVKEKYEIADTCVAAEEDIDNCYVWQATKERHWFGPTKAEISLVWLIGRGNFNKGKGGRR